MKELTEVKEIVECDDVNTANSYLEGKHKGEWILIYCFAGTQLCFSKVEVPGKEGGVFHKVQPFDKVIRIYIVGRIK